MAALRDVPSDEDKKLEELLDGAKPIIDFFKELGRAICRPHSMPASSVWLCPDCELEFSIEGEKFQAAGHYERVGNALLPTLGLKKVTKYKIEYKGRIVGSRIEGTVERVSDDDQQRSGMLSLLGDTKVEFAMVAQADGRSIAVVENPASVPRFYKLELVPVLS